jgi:acetolactate decarboxylase
MVWHSCNLPCPFNCSLIMRLLILTLFLPFSAVAQVKVAGEMRKIMQQADLSASVELDTINRSKLYGIGVVEGLKGEIIILDGKCYVTSVKGGQLETGNPVKAKAAMLVYQNVTSWSPAQSAKEIQNLKGLETFLEDLLSRKGKSQDIPFAFILKSVKGKINYHVIDWKNGVEHNMTNHKQFAKKGELTNAEVTILGFYSNRHQGVFTHHDTNLHLHVFTNDSKIVGHIDEIRLDQFELVVAE